MSLKTVCFNVFFFINRFLSIPNLLGPGEYNLLLFLISLSLYSLTVVGIYPSQTRRMQGRAGKLAFCPPVCIILVIIFLKTVKYFVYLRFSRSGPEEHSWGNHQIPWAQYLVVLNTRIRILDLVVSNPRGLKPGPKLCIPGELDWKGYTLCIRVKHPWQDRN